MSATTTYRFEGHEIVVTRRKIGTAYARNGNIGNPTVYYLWDVRLDGESLGSANTQWEGYEIAREHIEPTLRVRHWDGKRWRTSSIRPGIDVRAEMKAAKG